MRLVLALALTVGFAAPAFAQCGGHTASTPVTTAETTPQQSPLPPVVAAPVKK